MNVTKRFKPRFFIGITTKSFGTSRTAYRTLAKRQIASEFDHLGWYTDEERNIASPGLQAFRKTWCEHCDIGGDWRLSTRYHNKIKEVIEQLMSEDAAEQNDTPKS